MHDKKKYEKSIWRLDPIVTWDIQGGSDAELFPPWGLDTGSVGGEESC